MKKGIFIIDEQDPKKRNCLRHLHELLNEQQEPFLLEDFLLDRKYSNKGLHGNQEDNLSGGVTKMVLQQKKPKLTNPDALQYNRIESRLWASACHFLEMRLKQNKKGRYTGMNTKRGNLNTPRRSEECPAEEPNSNEKHFGCALHERKTAETEQLKPARYLNTDHGVISARKTEGMFTRMFSFEKDKKTKKDGKSKKEHEAEKTVNCFWFESILRKLAFSKEFVSNILRDPESFSKRFSPLDRQKPKGKFNRTEPVQLRVSDIVGWNSFGESNDGSTSEKSYVSLECTQTIADLTAKPHASATDPGDLQKTNEEISQETVLGIKQNKVNWRAILKRSNRMSLDLSSSSSSTLFDSYLESDIGSTSMAVPSSSGSLEDRMEADSQLHEGIDFCGLEASCCSGHLSFDTDENGVKDFQHRTRHRVAQSPGSTTSGGAVDNQLAQFGASNGTLRQDYMHQTSTLTGDLSILKLSDLKENTVNSLGHARADDWKSGKISYSSRENEEEKNAHSHFIAGTRWNENRDAHIHSHNLEYASDIGFFQRSKQRRPASVLEFNIAEGAAALEQSATDIGLAKKQLLQREYNHMDALRLEKKTASWKNSSKNESRNYIARDWDHIDCIKMADGSKIAFQPSLCKCQEDVHWEEVETEEYVRKALASPDTVSDYFSSSTSAWDRFDRNSYLAEGLNDRSMQAFTGCKLPSHAQSPSPLECPRRKQLPRQARNLLVDCAREVLEPPRKRYGSGLLTEARLEEWLGPEQLAKTISGQIRSWNKLDPNLVDKLLELLLRKGEEGWTKFRGEAEEIGIGIEVAIFGVLLEELVLDLASLQS